MASTDTKCLPVASTEPIDTKMKSVASTEPTETQLLPVASTKETGSSMSLSHRFLLSSSSAVVAEFVTYPMDLTKTRLQIQGEAKGTSQGAVYRGMVSTAWGVVREEGVMSLWKGVGASASRHVIYSGVRLTTYEFLREKVKVHTEGEVGLRHRVGLGMVCGAVGQFYASPADLVKVQMQMEGRRRIQTGEVTYRGPSEAFMGIFRSGGVTGLWKGAVPNMQRAALVNLGDLTMYDQAKTTLVGSGWDGSHWTTHVVASFCSGLAAATAGTPADVVKTRIMNQPVDSKGRGMYYKGVVDCVYHAVKEEGVMSLYKGFVPIWLRMAPWSLTFWLTFEKFRSFTKLESW